MQGNDRIDVLQIAAMGATEEHPITLHYGHHFHSSTVTSHHQRGHSTEMTSASSFLEQPIHKNTPLNAKQIPHSQPKFISQPIATIAPQSPDKQKIMTMKSSQSKILSVQEIKQAAKRKQKSGMRGVSGRGRPQWFPAHSREQNLLVPGPTISNSCNPSKQKLNLTKYLQLKAQQYQQL